MRNIKILAGLLLVMPIFSVAQQGKPLTLSDIFQRIDSNNILLGSYASRAEAYKYSAEAATAWMPPMAGVGTFMTPYPFQKIMEDRDKGSIMVRLEQEIPNRSKLQARKKYIASLGTIESANRAITFNDFRSQAKRQYFTWLVAAKRIQIIENNQRVLETMKKIEELRYPYNQSQLNTVYRAEAEIEKNRAMLAMPRGEIEKARAFLNALMNRPGNEEFHIDTSYEPGGISLGIYDTADLAIQRKDILKMNESIRSMQFNIEAMRQERKPDFRIQFDHMSPFSSMMPQAFSVMGMVSIPIVPWSRKMYRSEIKSMEFNIKAMESERASMLRETQGMVYGMQAEIQSMQRRIQSIEQKVIPALQKTFDASFLVYQENKLSMTVLIENWEALNMMQLDLLDEKQKLYQMIVDYEKEIYK